jgi:hypothetical protein
MTLQPENAATCFKRLLQESNSQKFHASLERIKKACDAIEDMKGLLNYSRVAQYTENHYGSPKRQSIMNSKQLRLYIDLRKQEYTQKSPGRNNKKSKNIGPQYPSPDLDLKTRVYIDQLRARNAFLEKAMSYLKQEVLCQTQKAPISLSKSIEAGAREDLSLEVVRQNQGNQSDEKLELIRTAIHKLLDLSNNVNCPLEIQNRNDKDFLVLETPLSQETILFDDELDVLNRLLL